MRDGGTDEGGELEGLGVVDDGTGDGDAHRRLPLRIRLLLLRVLLLLLLVDGLLLGRRGLAAEVLRGVFALVFLLLLVLVPGLLGGGCLRACRIHGGGGGRPGWICGVWCFF